MENSPYLNQPTRSEARARMERFRERIEPSGPCDRPMTDSRAVQRSWDLQDVMNELSNRLQALNGDLDDEVWAMNGRVEPCAAKIKRIGLAVEELGRDLRAFAEAI